MELSNLHRAEILVEALPYIQKYNGKILVIKYGGNAMINEELKQQVMEDVVLLHLIGVKVVLVHGGGPEISGMLKKINKTLVKLLESKGGKAMGISGIDGHMIDCEIKDERLGYVGEIKDVNVQPILDLLEKDYIPVISTVGCDLEGNTYNVNADTAAARIAGALNAKRLITMTDIMGIMMDPKDPDSLIPCIDLQDAQNLFDSGVIFGGMIPKVQCCIDAINHGVEKVIILDGRVPHAVLMEVLTDEGAGTMVVRDKNAKK